ncbi:hypothetical protein PLCT1_01877 [Planctomycetaceae bacterium]|nr:hypothetical protein PLCT1_01877 [Planctomycetaceae bacterium]
MNWLITLGIGVPLAAASVPVIIHLINLTRYRKVDWAAMEFLMAAYRKTRRRLQMESLIMLLLRVAAVIFLALAFFPFAVDEVKAMFSFEKATFSANAPLNLVVVLDNSASMAYTQEGQTSFDRAKKYALSIVDTLKPGRDRVTIVRMSDVFVPRGIGGVSLSEDEQQKRRKERVKLLTNLDLETARRELAATSVAAGDTTMLVALREAYRLMDITPPSDAVGLVVITDFANCGWKELKKDGANAGEFADVLEKVNKRIGEGGAPLFYDAGFDDSNNVAITNLTCQERVIGDGMETEIQVKLANFSARNDMRNVSLVYRVDGHETKSGGGKISLPQGELPDPVIIKLTANEIKLNNERERKTGASRHIEVEITEPDGLKADNRRSIVLNVVPDVPILVVNGVPDKNPNLNETLNLETALLISDSRSEDGASGSEVRVTPNRIITINPQQLTAQESFLDYRLVILANVATLPESTVSRLEEFVAAGFGLVIFDGDRVDHQRYNRDLFKEGKGLLPVQLKSPEGSNDIGAPNYALSPTEKSHPVLSVFMRGKDQAAIITDPKLIHNWRGVQLPQGSQVDPLRPVHVILGINKPGVPDPFPFMVERSYGRGRVIYFSSTAGPRWNDLWTDAGQGLPIFLYHETVSYLTNSEARYSNLTIGEPFRRVLRVRDIAPLYQVKDPSGGVVDVPSTSEDGVQLIEYAGTAVPGVYALSAMDKEGGQQIQKWQERFAVNTEPAESDVAKIGEDINAVLKDSLGEIRYEFQKAGGEGENRALMSDDTGGGAWLWCAVIAALFFLAESAWSLFISKPEQ